MRAVKVERLHANHTSRISITHIELCYAVTRQVAFIRAPSAADRPDECARLTELAKAPLADWWCTSTLCERYGERSVSRAPERRKVNAAVTGEVVHQDARVCRGVNLADQRWAAIKWCAVDAQVWRSAVTSRNHLGDEELLNPVVRGIYRIKAECGAGVKAGVSLKACMRIFQGAARVGRLDQAEAPVRRLTEVNHGRLPLCGGAGHDPAQQRLVAPE